MYRNIQETPHMRACTRTRIQFLQIHRYIGYIARLAPVSVHFGAEFAGTRLGTHL